MLTQAMGVCIVCVNICYVVELYGLGEKYCVNSKDNTVQDRIQYPIKTSILLTTNFVDTLDT